MSNLFNELPSGCFHLQNFVSAEDQKKLVELCRDLLKTHPLMQPKTRAGWNLSLQVSSWGKVGWFGRDGRYEYLKHHEREKNGRIVKQPFPPVPERVDEIISDALVECGYELIRLDTVLMNWYPAEIGKLGRHQDVTEEDQESPIVTISLGDSCIFNIGSTDFDFAGADLELRSGDVIVMGGESRKAYHEVKKLIPNTSALLPRGGRISLTGRRVFK